MAPASRPELKSLFVVPAAFALVFSVGLFMLGRLYGSLVVVAASVHWLLMFAVIVGARSQRVNPQPGSALAVRRVFIALLFLIVSLTGASLADGFMFVVPTESTNDVLAMGALMVASAGNLAAVVAWFSAPRNATVQDAVGLAKLGRVGVWLNLIGAASVFALYAGVTAFENEVCAVLVGLPGLLALELLARGIFALFRPAAADAAFGADLVLARVVGSSFNPIQSGFTSIEDTFGVDVRSSWALGFMRKVSFPLVMGLGLFAWSLSSFVVIDESQRAVRERLGKVSDGEVLQPGLNVGLPWPFDRVNIIDTERIRSMPLGFAGAKADANPLWTQNHAAEEYNLLIGNGRDLVTVNAELQYRISDVHQWVYGCQNPDEALETLAYRVLMEATVDRTLDEVLSKDIGRFSARLKESLQAQADQKGLGVELVALNLRGLHPPVALAMEYQAVIAAQLDRTTYIIDAEAYQESMLPKAHAEAESLLRSAAADRVERLSLARGEAIAFETLEAQYNANPELFRFRRRVEILESSLSGKPHHIIDSRIERDGGALWFLQ